MSGAIVAQQLVVPTPTPTPTPTPAPTPTPTPTPPPSQTCLVSLSSITVKSTTSYFASGSDFSPSTVGADTILSLLWGGDDYSSKGSLTLFLDGNTGTGTHSAVIQGVSVGSSGAGVYSASGGYTSYAWASPMPDPLGITNDVTIDCVIS